MFDYMFPLRSYHYVIEVNIDGKYVHIRVYEITSKISTQMFLAQKKHGFTMKKSFRFSLVIANGKFKSRNLFLLTSYEMLTPRKRYYSLRSIKYIAKFPHKYKTRYRIFLNFRHIEEQFNV